MSRRGVSVVRLGSTTTCWGVGVSTSGVPIQSRFPNLPTVKVMEAKIDPSLVGVGARVERVPPSSRVAPLKLTEVPLLL